MVHLWVGRNIPRAPWPQLLIPLAVLAGSMQAQAEEPKVVPLDTQPPQVDVRILDSGDVWQERSQLFEGRPYAFDAGTTSDDSFARPEDVANLTFSWDFGDGTRLGPGPGGDPDRLLNVTHSYSRFGEYRFNLTVWDETGNAGRMVRTLIVQANASSHPDLRVLPGNPQLSPIMPSTRSEFRVRVSIENVQGRGPSGLPRADFAIIVQGRPANLTISRLRMLDSQGAPIERLESGRGGFIEFVVLAPPRAGSYLVRVRVWDGDEPPAWIDTANQVTMTITVTVDVYGGTLAVVALTALSVVATVGGLRRMDARRRAGRRSVLR